jgi:hypothetical protein
MLFSGELSMTTSALELVLVGVELVVAAGALEAAPAGGELVVLAGVVEVELEHAARPAARRPVAASATALLLAILLIVNFDLSSRVSE